MSCSAFGFGETEKGINKNTPLGYTASLSILFGIHGCPELSDKKYLLQINFFLSHFITFF